MYGFPWIISITPMNPTSAYICYSHCQEITLKRTTQHLCSFNFVSNDISGSAMVILLTVTFFHSMQIVL